jgi:hypothetical protein
MFLPRVSELHGFGFQVLAQMCDESPSKHFMAQEAETQHRLCQHCQLSVCVHVCVLREKGGIPLLPVCTALSKNFAS